VLQLSAQTKPLLAAVPDIQKRLPPLEAAVQQLGSQPAAAAAAEPASAAFSFTSASAPSFGPSSPSFVASTRSPQRISATALAMRSGDSVNAGVQPA
jgi:hypothetical protein